MKYIKILAIGILASFLGACTSDLDVVPLDPDLQTIEQLLSQPGGDKQVLAKLYAGLVLTGQQGPTGNADIISDDEGSTAFLRLLWKLQELPTDEAIVAWGDGGLQNINRNSWSETNGFITFFYDRIYYEITLANFFIRFTAGSSDTEVQAYNAEARFLRAFAYYYALDCFGNVPFADESVQVGDDAPPRIERADLFAWLETELLELETALKADGTNEFGRVDAVAAQMLLARLYLNAEVYTGTARWNDALTYASKVLSSSYTLNDNYANIFRGDNETADGIIFRGVLDANFSQSYGATTFLVNASIGGDMVAADYGSPGGWGGIRARPEFVDIFDTNNNGMPDDPRGIFFTAHNREVEEISAFTDGYGVNKWNNLTSTGQDISNNDQSPIDFPFMRLAEAHLIYAEAVAQGATNGSTTQAVDYINDLRERAYGNTSANISATDLTVDFMLDERSRELYWEGFRRTDLIRHGKFTSASYLWSWKGGIQAGTSFNSNYRLYPIPSTDLAANPNLKQNDGY